MRDELLNETLFRSLPHARAVLEVWRRDYNEERPHSKLGWMTPRGYASALRGNAGRDAALRWAPRSGLLPPTKQKVQINPGLASQLDEKRGSRHRRQRTAARQADGIACPAVLTACLP